MPLHDSQAFVLRTYKLAEADKICVFLTRNFGKIRGIAYGARKMRSRFGSSLEQFTEVSLTFFQKEGRELVSVSGAEIQHSHFNESARSVQAGAAMSYMADMLCEFLPDHEPNETAYRLVGATLGALERDADVNAIVRYFEVWLLKIAGFYPDLRRCAACDAAIPVDEDVWLSIEGSPRCRDCSGGRGLRVGRQMRAALARMLAESPEGFAKSPPSDEVLDRFAEVALAIVRHSLERDLKSYAIFNRLRREAESGLGPAIRQERQTSGARADGGEDQASDREGEVEIRTTEP
jgi:DNA repair protein RecO (recombination protein O)